MIVAQKAGSLLNWSECKIEEVPCLGSNGPNVKLKRFLVRLSWYLALASYFKVTTKTELNREEQHFATGRFSWLGTKPS